MLGTIKHYLSSFSKYLVNNCSMKSIAVEPVKGLKKDKNLSSKSLLTTWGDNGRRDMQAKRHHYKATENMQRKKKKGCKVLWKCRRETIHCGVSVEDERLRIGF